MGSSNNWEQLLLSIVREWEDGDLSIYVMGGNMYYAGIQVSAADEDGCVRVRYARLGAESALHVWYPTENAAVDDIRQAVRMWVEEQRDFKKGGDRTWYAVGKGRTQKIIPLAPNPDPCSSPQNPL